MSWVRISTVDREIFAFKYFRVINVRVSNFHHKVQEVKIIHGVFYFRVLNFRRPRERQKIFNGEYFPIYGSTYIIYLFLYVIKVHIIYFCVFSVSDTIP